MTQAHQARAMLAGLVVLGEPCSLAGVDCTANIERDVDLFAGIGDTAHDNHVVTSTVVAVAATPAGNDFAGRRACGSTPADYSPRTGQLLVHRTGRYRLDRLLTDNQAVRRFVAVKVA